MKKNIIFFLIFILIISIGINLYFLNSKKSDSFVENKQTNLEIKSDDSFKSDKIELKDFLNDDNLTLPNFYSRLEWNLFNLMNNEFKKVNNLDSFKKFDKKYESINYLIWIAKLKDKTLWDKYFDFIFKKLKLNDRVSYDNKLDTLFEKIKKWENIVFDENELDFDIQYYFNTDSIDLSLSRCNNLKNINSSFSNIDSCKDKIYFYRANKKNHFCDKISDKFKMRICKDFLKYQEKLNK